MSLVPLPLIIPAKQDRRVYRPKTKFASTIPDEILKNPILLSDMKRLPENYNFEIPKTIWRIRKDEAKCVALQFPEGLLIFALHIADVLRHFTGAEVIIMGDVTYGACCIDDYTARALGADFMVHYGHSCLIPVNVTQNINMLYIFVDIKIDTLHFINTIEKNFSKESRIALGSTIQFVSTLQHVATDFKSSGYHILLPQSKPLSPGEVLGCTSPQIKNCDIFVFLGDGRFHIESTMIANPYMKFYRYNPYDKVLTEETYDHSRLTLLRKLAIDCAVNSTIFGLILGTLGRQGSFKVMNNIQLILKKNKRRYVNILLSEIFPEKLNLFSNIDGWIQTACPRLSIDWGYAFSKPLLTPYELAVAMKIIAWKEIYPMDFYASQSIGAWTPNHKHVDCDNHIGTCKNCIDCGCSIEAK